MSNVIESMIEAQGAIVRAAQEEREQARKQKTEKLLEQLKTELGDFYSLLVERKIPVVVSYDNSGSPRFEISIPASEEDRLAPIGILWDGRSSYGNSFPFHTLGNSFSKLPEAIAEARKKYEGWKEKIRKEKVEAYQADLNHNWNGRDLTEEQARETFESFVSEFPELREAAQVSLDRWLEARREYIARKEQERQEKRDREAAQVLKRSQEKEYLEKLVSWLSMLDELEATNKAIAEAIQAEADSTPYPAYKLTYALVATYNEDEETFRELETRSAYSLYVAPDSFGFWDIDGKKLKIFNPVSLEMIFVRASSGILARKFQKSGLELFFPPETPDATIAEALDRIQVLPDEPERPDFVRYDSERGAYMRRARDIMQGGEGSDNELEF